MARSFTSLVILAASLVSALCLPAPVCAQEAAVAASTAVLTTEQIETFLLNAQIVTSRKLGKGVTGSRVATLSDGRLTHDAHVQHVNIEKPAERAFKDQYRYNIAAYRIARVLGLTNVPVSVERKVDDRPAAVTWWVDGVLMDEEERAAREKNKTMPGWPRAKIVGSLQVMKVFDELIANADRNAGNQLWTNDGTLWLIDHTRAFRLQTALKKPEKLERCSRDLWKGLRELTLEAVTTAVADSLTKGEIKALMARRNIIVKRFEEMIADRGEAAIIFSPMP
jgi:hypothetical protein